MKPYQERVVAEEKELQDKIDNLTSFIMASPIFKTLPSEEKRRLELQCDLMIRYSTVLRARIRAFEA